jgi:hypothetical protein
VNTDEHMAFGFQWGLSHPGPKGSDILDHEKDWFWDKVRSFASEGNPDPIGSVVKEFQLWPNRSSGGSSNATTEKLPVDQGGRSSEASRVLDHVVSVVKSFTGLSVTWKEASFSTYVKTGPHWSLRFDVKTYQDNQHKDLGRFIALLSAELPEVKITYIQLHNVGGYYWAVDVEVPV